MKLYVKKPESGEKIYLKFEAETRIELQQKIGKYEFFIDGIEYNIDNVIAEEDNIDKIRTITGLAAGAAIGPVILGVIGLPIGAITGTVLGVFAAKELLGDNLIGREKERVERFNQIKLKPTIKGN